MPTNTGKPKHSNGAVNGYLHR